MPVVLASGAAVAFEPGWSASSTCRTAKCGVSEKKGTVLAMDSRVQKKRAARGVGAARNGSASATKASREEIKRQSHSLNHEGSGHAGRRQCLTHGGSGNAQGKGSVSYRRAISSVVRRGRRRAVGAGFVKEVAGLGLHPRPAAEERALALAPRL